MKRRAAVLAALCLFAGSIFASDATAQSFGLGAGFGYAEFTGIDGVDGEANVAAFLEYQAPVDLGRPSGEYDENGDEIFLPNWYAGIGYSALADETPLQGAYLLAYRRIAETDLFFGAGPQVEIWNREILGSRELAFGFKAVLELPGLSSEVPIRATASVATRDDVRRVEVTLTGIN